MVWCCVQEFVDEVSLIRVSGVNREAHGSVRRRLFEPDVCVHCGENFCLLDQRRGACLEIHNKPHRRHVGSRVATKREKSQWQRLLENRKRIASRSRSRVDDDRKEVCARCRRRYLPWKVGNQFTIPDPQLDFLCTSCFLKITDGNLLFSWKTGVISLIIILLVFFLTLLAAGIFSFEKKSSCF